ncbi:MAG TPA: delta-60 repeat domain-containing protein, partial [Actinomycetota bacterium]|nr:delta-60 repeat domain-containing protein [Actinomycetota bacterium]
MRRRALGLLSVTLLVTAAPLGAATGQTGILDPTFGGDGTVTTALTTPWFSESEDSANAIALLPDGRIVAAGSVGCRLSVIDRACSFAVARYLADGALDASFSGDGIATVRFPSGGAA